MAETLREGAEADAAIVQAILDGATPLVAARSQGYSRVRWEQRMDVDLAFLTRVMTAQAQCEIDMIREVRRADKPGGTGFLLERRFSERWSGSLKQKLDEERAELLASLKAGLDELTFRRVVGIADAAEVAKRKKSA